MGKKSRTQFQNIFDGLYSTLSGTKKKSWSELHSFFDIVSKGGVGKGTVKAQLDEYRSWVNIATSVIYRRVSTVDYKYFRDDTGEEIKRGTVQHKIINKIFRDPNPYMEFRFLKQYLQLQLDLTGMAFCLRIDDPVFGLPRELWPLNVNDLVAIEVSDLANTSGLKLFNSNSVLQKDRKFPFKDWILGFTFMIGGRRITFKWDNILYFHYPHPKDPRAGSSPIQNQAYAIDVDHYIEVYERDFFRNSARPDFAIKYPMDVSMDEEDAERLRVSWKKKFQGQGEGKYHELAILDRGAEIHELGPKNEDLALMFLANWAQDKVLAAYGVPPGKVGMVKDVNRANAEGIDVTFQSECVKPRLDLMDEVFSRGVLQRFDDRYMIKHNNPVPRDRKLDIEEVKNKVQVPIWTPNEARELEGKLAKPGGDELYIQMQYLPMGTPPAPTASAKPKEEEEEEEEESHPKAIETKGVQRTEEWRVRQWKLADATAIQWEAIWKSRLRVIFTEQQEEVLRNLEKYAPEAVRTFRKKSKMRKNFILLYNKTLYNYIGIHRKKVAEKIKEDVQELDRLLLIREQEFIDLVVEGIIKEKNLDTVLTDINQFFVRKQKDVIDHILFDWDDNEKLFTRESRRIHTGLLKESGQAVLDEFGIDIDFNLDSPLAREYLADKVREFSSYVLSTKTDQLKRTLSEGLAKGESMQKLKSRVQSVYGSVLRGGYEAERIARTETISSLNAGKLEGYEQGGVVQEKEWLSARTAGTRGADAGDKADHWHLDGQRVALDAPFIDPRSGAMLKFPGDTSLGAGGPDVINCKCSMLGNLEVTQVDEQQAPMNAIGDFSNCIIGKSSQTFLVHKKPVSCTDYVRTDAGKWLLRGEEVINEKELVRLNRMRIPPAWRKVVVAADEKIKIQAIGLDNAGRWQYRYSEEHITKAARQKFDRLKLFNRDMPDIRKKIKIGMVNKDSRAFLLELENRTAIRAGSLRDFKAKKKAYGLTTLQFEHVTIEGDKIILDFVAKEGLPAHYELTDKKLAIWLKKRKAGTVVGERLFPDISSTRLNSYIKELAKGKEYTIKDFRTYHGTRIAFEELSEYRGAVLSVKEKREIVKEVVEKVSSFLRNTPAMAKKSYIDPMVWDCIGGL